MCVEFTLAVGVAVVSTHNALAPLRLTRSRHSIVAKAVVVASFPARPARFCSSVHASVVPWIGRECRVQAVKGCVKRCLPVPYFSVVHPTCPYCYINMLQLFLPESLLVFASELETWRWRRPRTWCSSTSTRSATTASRPTSSRASTVRARSCLASDLFRETHTRSSFLAASDLRKKVAVITKDERGYGLTVHSESPVIVQSVKDGGWLHSSTTRSRRAAFYSAVVVLLQVARPSEQVSARET